MGCSTCMRSRGYVASKSTRPAGASAESAQAAQTRCSSLRRQFDAASVAQHARHTHCAVRQALGHACSPGRGKGKCEGACDSPCSQLHSTAAASEPSMDKQARRRQAGAPGARRTCCAPARPAAGCRAARTPPPPAALRPQAHCRAGGSRAPAAPSSGPWRPACGHAGPCIPGAS